MTTTYDDPCVETKSFAAKERRMSVGPVSMRANDDFLLSFQENGFTGSSSMPNSKQGLALPHTNKGHANGMMLGSRNNGQKRTQSSRPIKGGGGFDPSMTDNEDDALMHRWTLSPMSSLQSSSISEIPFISPQSTINTKRSYPGSAASEVRVETGLLNKLPRELCLSPSREPCAVFAVRNLETGKPRWFFAKEYEQLANFNDLIQHLLAPVFRQTKFRLREFPNRELFRAKTPWKVDIRNDMLNAYFKSLFWLYDIDFYKEDLALQEAVERAVNGLWLYDKVEPSPMRSFGLLGQEMCGFLLSRARTRAVEWDCHYYAMNGSYLDVIDDLSTGHVLYSINLLKAHIEKLIVLYLAKEDNARYAINIYERKSSGKLRLHTLSAENECVREKWLLHLRQRVSHLTTGDVSQGSRSKTKAPPLPYVLPRSPHRSPYLPDPVWDDARRSRKSTHRTLTSLSEDVPDAALTSHLFCHPEWSGERDQRYLRDCSLSSSCSDASNVSVSAISKPMPILELSRDTVIAQAIALDAQSAQLDMAPTSPLHGKDSLNGILAAKGAQTASKPDTRQLGDIDKTNSPSKQRKRGTVSTVFGVMPRDCRRLRKLSDGTSVPSVVARCLEVLRRGQASEELGIFRISGTQKKLDELESLFDQYGDYDMVKGKVDVHTTADLLKRYLRELPNGLFVDYPEWRLQQILALNEQEQVEATKGDVAALDAVSYAVVRAIIELLQCVRTKEAKNAMGLRNICVAMSPSLRVPIPILEICVSQYAAIFME